MHISHMVCVVSYFAYCAYFAYAGVNILFCNFLSKKRHCQIKHQKVKLPCNANKFYSGLTDEKTPNGIRTRDLRLVILTLYQLEQLSYVFSPYFVY